MGFDDLARTIGRVVSVSMNLLPGDPVEPVTSFAGEVVWVSTNWATEYNMLFRGGERVALLQGDTVTVDGERFILR